MRIQVDTTYQAQLTARHVRKVLAWINPKHLEGLECVRLLDSAPDDPESEAQPPYLRGFLYNGIYNEPSRNGKNEAANIFLYTRDLYYGIPKVLRWSPLAKAKIGFILAHEIGHHLIASRGYIFSPDEAYPPARYGWGSLDELRNRKDEMAADKYANQVVRRHFSYLFGRLLADLLSVFLCEGGFRDYKKKRFRTAADRLFRSYILNKENEDAGQYYLRAKQALITHKPSLLTSSEQEWIDRLLLETGINAVEKRSSVQLQHDDYYRLTILPPNCV